MITQTELHFDLKPIIEQVNSLDMSSRSLQLNETTGNLLTGKYTIKPEFLNTPLGDVLESLGDIGEARLLKLESEEVYTAHTDPDDRFHLIISTTPYAYIVDCENDVLFHLPANGYVYYMDTSIMHSAVNLGGTERIHLNVRVRLPEISYPCHELTFKIKDEAEWKQKLYNSMMGYINKQVKIGIVTGIEKVDERSIKLNAHVKVIDDIVQAVKSIGYDVGVRVVQH